MICFCFAMEKEAEPFLKVCQIEKEETSGFARMLLCSYKGQRFLALISGIGKGFACSGLTAAILKYAPSAVINAGVAGTLDGEKAPILSAVLSSDLIQHDMDTSLLGDPKGFLSGIEKVHLPSDPKLRVLLAKACSDAGVPCTEGLISSGDTFMANGSPRKEEVIASFNPLVVDMESACFAQVAYVYNVPFCSLRLISDFRHPETEYGQNAGECCKRIGKILETLLEENTL